MKPVSLLIPLTVLLVSCGTAGTKTGNTERSELPYHVDLTHYEQRDLFLSEFAEDVNYIRLESNGVNIGNEVNVFAEADRIMVNADNKEFNAFSRTGKFLNNIGAIGKGPTEYRMPSNCQYDFENGKFYIDADKGEVQVYNIDGDYEKTFRFSGYNDDMQFLYARSKFYVTGATVPTDKYYPLAIYNPDGSLLNQYAINLPHLTEKPSTSPKTTLQLTTENRVLLAGYSWDTTFMISEKGDWLPYVIFNRGPGQMPESERFYYFRINMYLDKLCIARAILDVGSGFLMELRVPPGKYLMAYFSKPTGELIEIKNFGPTAEDKKYGIPNDLDGGPKFSSFTFSGNYGYCAHQAIDLIGWKKSGYFDRLEPKYPEKKKQLFAMIDSLKPDDNPVIMIVNLKDLK